MAPGAQREGHSRSRALLSFIPRCHHCVEMGCNPQRSPSSQNQRRRTKKKNRSFFFRFCLSGHHEPSPSCRMRSKTVADIHLVGFYVRPPRATAGRLLGFLRLVVAAQQWRDNQHLFSCKNLGAHTHPERRERAASFIWSLSLPVGPTNPPPKK